MTKEAKGNDTILKISVDITDKDFSQDYQVGDGTCYTNGNKRKCKLYTTFASWSATALFQMTDMQTGEVFQQKHISKKSKAQKQAERGYVKFDKNDGFKRVMVDISKKFSLAIQPHKERVRVKLFKDDKLPDLEKGIKFAKMSNWSNAAKYFKKSD